MKRCECRMDEVKNDNDHMNDTKEASQEFGPMNTDEAARDKRKLIDIQ